MTLASVVLPGMFGLAVPIFASSGVAVAADVREIILTLHHATAEHPADFTGRDLAELDLSGLDLRGASFAGANLYGVDLTDADLSGTDLTGARLDHAIVIRARFNNARMARASILLPAAFSTLTADQAESPVFAGADLSGAQILGRFGRGDWRGVNLSGANFTGGGVRFLASWFADLSGCQLAGANLARADLRQVRLRFVDFSGANLAGAKLAQADLSHANLEGADLSGADLTGADLDGTILRGAVGLDSAHGLPAWSVQDVH
jgi:uncharacterized protein YjbI with pentapeptide repeats